MDELEEAIAQLQAENRTLHTRNDELRSTSLSLTNENKSLQERLEKIEQSNAIQCNNVGNRATPISGCNESAALAGPQQKGRTPILVTALLAALMAQLLAVKPNT